MDIWLRQFLAALEASCASLFALIDVAGTMRKTGYIYSTRIVVRLKNETESNAAYDLSRTKLTPSSRPIRVQMCLQNVIPQLRLQHGVNLLHLLGDRAMGFMKEKCGGDDQSKPDFGPPVRIYEVVNGIPPKPEIVMHTKSKGWEVVDEEKLKRLCTGLTTEEFLEEMNGKE